MFNSIRRRTRLAASCAGALTLLGIAALTVAPAADAAAYQCVGAQFKLYDNWNGGGVSGGGSQPRFKTNGQAYCLDSISTYHWNNGHGAKPGLIGLSGTGRRLGPWQAVGATGQGGTANVDWTATPSSARSPVIISGTYRCSDSSPSTWSQDAASGGHGFCEVIVQRAQLTTAGGGSTGSGTHGRIGNPCGEATTYGNPTPYPATIWYPHIVQAGQPAGVLLACGSLSSSDWAVKAYAPTSVELCPIGTQSDFQYDPLSRSYQVVTQVAPRCYTVQVLPGALPAQELTVPTTSVPSGHWFGIVSAPNGQFEIANTLTLS